MEHKFIVIEGNIGAGKTSLTKMLKTDYNAKAVYEQFADNPFLAKFYDDPEHYSFQLELSFLADRYQQLKNELSNRDVFRSLIISDYYFSKSLIFGKNTLSGDEYALYRRIFSIIYSSLPKPDLYVYLHKNTNKLIENIKSRGRDYEQNINAEYLQKIQDGYFEYFKHQKQFAFLIIDTNTVDFVNSTEDYEKIKELIFNNTYEAGMHMKTIE
jgi:deoxyadenosine/deoxycytidine kinase